MESYAMYRMSRTDPLSLEEKLGILKLMQDEADSPLRASALETAVEALETALENMDHVKGRCGCKKHHRGQEDDEGDDDGSDGPMAHGGPQSGSGPGLAYGLAYG